MVKEMHLKENTLFDLDPKVKVIRNVAQYPRNHVIFAPGKLNVDTSHEYVRGTQNVAQCPLHHVVYEHTGFEVTTSKGLGEDAFTKKIII